jgi:mevalonate kinase
VKIRSTIPLGSGLGSSAALAVAIVRAMRGSSGLEPAEVARRANELEKLAHGTPSGIDAATIALQRPTIFCKGACPPPAIPAAPLRPAREIRFVVGVLPRIGTTASLVGGVHRLKEADPARFTRALDLIRSVVENDGSAGITFGAPERLAAAMRANRAALLDLGVSTPAVEAACDAAVAAGALAAKLSGAGGGGAVIALLGPQSDPDRVVAALRSAGALDAFVTEVPAS